ncbi:transcriptional repressor NF-X1-like isoform X2 [Anneissia japonica]|uniref:transcriptional repressor NF-X1-like isoform X2 n=1 Tax=Anneissia japonica TaxID=1529436 RepID=UPI0014258E77|nr:transcriptional repressor NF-X1-like isoform X2 [Anneissia japonica]
MSHDEQAAYLGNPNHDRPENSSYQDTSRTWSKEYGRGRGRGRGRHWNPPRQHYPIPNSHMMYPVDGPSLWNVPRNSNDFASGQFVYGASSYNPQLTMLMTPEGAVYNGPVEGMHHYQGYRQYNQQWNYGSNVGNPRWNNNNQRSDRRGLKHKPHERRKDSSNVPSTRNSNDHELTEENRIQGKSGEDSEYRTPQQDEIETSEKEKKNTTTEKKNEYKKDGTSGRKNLPMNGRVNDGRRQDADGKKVNENKHRIPNRNKFEEWNRKIENKYGKKQTVFRKNVREKYEKELTEKNEGQKQSLESQTGTLIEQLTNQSYECMVCCDAIKAAAPTWNCQNCFAVFHMKCIKRWARSNIHQLETEGESWMCPGCRSPVSKVPYVYKCFCGKMRDPPHIPGETPHSCSNVCSRKRSPVLQCPHLCNILCHPGPCPPCPANVTVHCLCKKSQQTTRCGSGHVYRCEDTCGKMRNCGIHQCQEVCHSGDCDPCQEKITQDCFGQHTSRDVVCGGEQALIPCEEKESGIYSCLSECGRELDCGFHKCKIPCHPGDCEPCQLGPDKLNRCPCNQTLLSDLEALVRTSCRDPIPTCNKNCGRPLKCGGESELHLCQSKCHEGECPACVTGTSSVKCRCGNRFVDISCKDLINLPPEEQLKCDRKCNKKMHCGRHKCQNKCCINTEHVCIQQCGRWLTCRQHRCEEPCHLGNCHQCYNVSFDELYCYCGQQMLMPPIHCGTKPPVCDQLCTRSHPCDHAVRHQCHSEAECPPCTELCSKSCMGGHEIRNSIPCYLREFTCGNPCGKELPCGQHRCRKRCHNDPCDSAPCDQTCMVIRSDCGHPCGAPCHVDQPCPKTQCKTKLTISCACGNRTDHVMCLLGGDDSQMAQLFQKLSTSNLASKMHGLQSGESMDISSLMALNDGRKTRQLECNEECALIERNKRFALALQIKNPDFASKIGTPNYTEFLKDQAKNQPQLVSSIEDAIKAVVLSAQQSKQPKRSHSFQPMNRDKRRIVHELAEFYGCQAQSYDMEPNRSVVVTAAKDTCFSPSVSLMDFVQRGTRKKLPPPTRTNAEVFHSKYTPLGSAKNVKDVEDVDKQVPETKSEVIDYFDMT